ncbi:MAG TPA: endonuclease/exonuclease/phosphatase family protein [Blastococcus sp.]|jgi:endonuclease/exonuclease/phosphatase (EEP) superfamily protein YafD|nr:endonuclease/exonuclease/phosphatase family protein [Blastococcus sp.]
MPINRRRAAAVAAALPWATWAAVRLTGAERGFPAVPALTFTPHAAATVVVPIGLALRARSRAGLLMSAGAGAALAGAVPARRGATAPPHPDGVPLRVATVSLRLGLVAAGPVLDLVGRFDVDVLSMQELTPEAEERLRAAGIDALLPYSSVVPARPGAPPAASGAVWSRRPLRPQGAVPGGFEQPTVVLDGAGGREVELTAVHITPPLTSAELVRGWEGDLAGLPSPAPGVLRVLAGDFNASFDHASFRRLLARGYTDAARAVGRARVWTWAPLRPRFPRLTIDHVLVDPRIAVAAVEVVAIEGSDHRSVVATLVVPRN